MANPKLATTDYVDGEVAKKQGYFADVSVDETTGNRELSLKDATDNVVGQIIAQKEGGVLLKDVATPTEATDGANKGYADNNFANALKGTASSASIRVDDVSPIEHILGVKVSSKNLIPYPYTDTTKTLNGITFTVNADGSISLSGTSTGQATFYFMYKTLNLKQGVTYTLSASGNYSFGGTATIYIYDSAQGQSAYIPLATATSATFTPTKDVNNTNCYLVVPTNRTVSGTLKIQLELGSTATDYTPYVDLTAVKVTRCGKNLFNQALLTDWGLVLTDGKYVGSSSYFNGKTLASNFQNNTQYTISLKGYNTNSTEASILISVNYTDGTSATIIRLTAKSETEYKFTTAAGKTVSSFKSNYYNADTVNISYIQIEEGSTATTYEPYQGQTYTPAADGTVSGVKSLYPTTTLMTDTDGVIIDCEYNRDINKAFAALEAAIATNNS